MHFPLTGGRNAAITLAALTGNKEIWKVLNTEAVQATDAGKSAVAAYKSHFPDHFPASAEPSDEQTGVESKEEVTDAEPTAPVEDDYETSGAFDVEAAEGVDETAAVEDVAKAGVEVEEEYTAEADTTSENQKIAEKLEQLQSLLENAQTEEESAQ